MKLEHDKSINRLVIYFFYDKDGVVDRYVPYILGDIKKNCSELFVVCNGKLNRAGRETFHRFTQNLLVRDDIGFDVWAYKAAFDYYGWEKLCEFDEIVMTNHTIMGPVYPFAEMFTEMDCRDLDFWGITKHHYTPKNRTNIEYGSVEEYIQTHFIAVRKPMIQSLEFQEYWKNRPEIKRRKDAVEKHEAIFTKRFADMGFRWDVYVETEDMKKFCDNPILDHPVNLLREKKCPIFLKHVFCNNYGKVLAKSAGLQGKELLCYIKEHTGYDVGMVWENIIRTENMASIKECLGLNYILPKDCIKNDTVERRVALVIHAYFDDLVNYCYEYALSMPEYSDIYITVGSDKLEQIVKDKFCGGPWNRVKVIRIENRGRDVSALLVGAAEYLLDYDYVCFVHDKKVTQLNQGIIGYAFSERCFQNVLGSREYVQNILNQFEEEPNLGMLCPPPPNFSHYYPTLGVEWGPNYKCTKELYKKLDLSCPISEDREPIAPLGTMFWFRPVAMKLLLEYGWKYKDFPPEPNDVDGTLLHAIERIYAFVIQDAGYYCAWVMNDEYAKTEWGNLSYMLRSINVELFKSYGYHTQADLLNEVKTNENMDSLKRKTSMSEKFARFRVMIKKRTPPRLWNCMRSIYRSIFKKPIR